VRLLSGEAAWQLLRNTRIILFGVGGVGSWCAEALVRSGVGALTIVDFDTVCETNINRQVQATGDSVGEWKVDALARKLRSIDPDVAITALHDKYERGAGDRFGLSKYDYVVDAIDSLSAKVDLIISAGEANVRLFTALGAGGRVDPTLLRVAPLRKSHGCRLGRMVRKRLHRRGYTGNPLCVFSEELSLRQNVRCDGEDSDDDEGGGDPPRINGSMVHVTGCAGFFLAGLVIQDVISRAQDGCERG